MVSHPRCGLPAAALTRISATGPSAGPMSEGNIPERIEIAYLSVEIQPFRDGRTAKNGAYPPLQDIHLNTREFWSTVDYGL
jgi:hypothetical protein